MSVIYVNSGASGANNGTSWTDAYTSIASTTGAAAGDIIRVSYQHVEGGATATVSWDWTNGVPFNKVRIISTDPADDSYRTGATIGNTGASNVDMHLLGCIWIAGCVLQSRRTLYFLDTGNQIDSAELEDCTLSWHGGNGNKTIQFGQVGQNTQTILLRNCTIDCTNASTSRTLVCQAFQTVFDCLAFTEYPSSTTALVTTGSGRYGWAATFVGCDLSGVASDLVDAFSTSYGGMVSFDGCKFPSGYNLNSTTETTSMGQSSSIIATNCGVGSLSVPPLGLTKASVVAGHVTGDTSRYRTGGADDGWQSNGHSWAMSTESVTTELYTPLRAPPVATWVTGGASITVTLYVASGVTLQDDEFWVELKGPAASAVANYYCDSSRLTIAGTPANITSDGTSTWNGSGVGTAQKISFTYTPALDGFLIVTFCLAKASTTVYVDPAIDIDGSVRPIWRMHNYTQVGMESGSGGGSGCVIVPHHHHGLQGVLAS